MPTEAPPTGPDPRLSDRLAAALELAVELHRDQARKGTRIPYVAHLLGVAAIVLAHGGDEDEAIAALLHDAVEDQGGAPTLATIEARFGQDVAEIVAACSDTDVVPKPPWRRRKEDYLHHLPSASDSARLVSAADKLDNARAILSDYRRHGEALWLRFQGGREGTLWYYRALADTFLAVGPATLAAELDRVVQELEAAVRQLPESP
jgi:GTP pyrophosphokinase